MACDLVVAAEGTKLGEPEIRYGSAPVTLLMPYLIGQKRTRELLLTGDLIDAVEAERIGPHQPGRAGRPAGRRGGRPGRPAGPHAARGHGPDQADAQPGHGRGRLPAGRRGRSGPRRDHQRRGHARAARVGRDRPARWPEGRPGLARPALRRAPGGQRPGRRRRPRATPRPTDAYRSAAGGPRYGRRDPSVRWSPTPGLVECSQTHCTATARSPSGRARRGTTSVDQAPHRGERPSRQGIARHAPGIRPSSRPPVERAGRARAAAVAASWPSCSGSPPSASAPACSRWPSSPTRRLDRRAFAAGTIDITSSPDDRLHGHRPWSRATPSPGPDHRQRRHRPPCATRCGTRRQRHARRHADPPDQDPGHELRRVRRHGRAGRDGPRWRRRSAAPPRAPRPATASWPPRPARSCASGSRCRWRSRQRPPGPDLGRDLHLRRRADRQQPVIRFRLHPGARPGRRVALRSRSTRQDAMATTRPGPAPTARLAIAGRLVDLVLLGGHRRRPDARSSWAGSCRRSATRCSSSPGRRWPRPSPSGRRRPRPGRPAELARRRRRQPDQTARRGPSSPTASSASSSATDGRWIETQGDANAAPDPSLTPATPVIGRVGVAVPYAGYLLTLLSSLPGLVLRPGRRAPRCWSSAGGWTTWPLDRRRRAARAGSAAAWVSAPAPTRDAAGAGRGRDRAHRPCRPAPSTPCGRAGRPPCRQALEAGQTGRVRACPIPARQRRGPAPVRPDGIAADAGPTWRAADHAPPGTSGTRHGPARRRRHRRLGRAPTLAAFTDSDTVSGSFASDTLAPPTGLAATGGASVGLTWTPTVDTYATGYAVWRGRPAAGPTRRSARSRRAAPRRRPTRRRPAPGSTSCARSTARGRARTATRHRRRSAARRPPRPTPGASPGRRHDRRRRQRRLPDDPDPGLRRWRWQRPGPEQRDRRQRSRAAPARTPDPTKDRHRFWGFATGLPGTVSSIAGIRVRADLGLNNNGGTTNLCAQLSWDGGTTWTTHQVDRRDRHRRDDLHVRRHDRHLGPDLDAGRARAGQPRRPAHRRLVAGQQALRARLPGGERHLHALGARPARARSARSPAG